MKSQFHCWSNTTPPSFLKRRLPPRKNNLCGIKPAGAILCPVAKIESWMVKLHLQQLTERSDYKVLQKTDLVQYYSTLEEIQSIEHPGIARCQQGRWPPRSHSDLFSVLRMEMKNVCIKFARARNPYLSWCHLNHLGGGHPRRREGRWRDAKQDAPVTTAKGEQ